MKFSTVIRSAKALALSAGILWLLNVSPGLLSADPVIGVDHPNAPAQLHLRYRIVIDQGSWGAIKTDQWYLPVQIQDGLQAQLIDKLIKSGDFVVLDRQASTVTQEHNEDAIDAAKRDSLPAGSALAPRVQRTAGAYIITPTVIGFSQTTASNKGIDFRTFSLEGTKLISSVTLNIRISDAQTGSIIDSQTSVGTASVKEKSAAVHWNGDTISQQDFAASPAGQATDSALDIAIGKIAGRLAQEPWKAVVAKQDETTGRVIITAGGVSGVVVGDVFDVYRAGQPVTDPDTGDIISQGDEIKIGRVRVARVDDNASYCDIIEGNAFQVHDIVRPAK